MARVRLPKLPDPLEPVGELISRREKAFKRDAGRRKAERWIPMDLEDERGPFVVVFFGDPHLDDNHCNWPLLKEHVALASRPHVYGVCVGDKANNWVGRLMREYAEQHVTKSDARRLAHWYLSGCGVNWLFHVLGNHDAWNEGETIYDLLNVDGHYFVNWDARVELRAGGDKWRIQVAHDFKGTSIYNKTHGPSRAAMFSGGAELYVCGHKHCFGTQSFEIEETGRVVHAVRARGYKDFDTYALTNGFPQGTAGSAVAALFWPGAKDAGARITTFADPKIAVAVLESLHEMKAAKSKSKAKTKAKKNGADNRNRRTAGRGKKHGRK